MLEPTTLSYDGYRFGYNGMERDDEVKSKRNIGGGIIIGKGNSYDYGARFYDPRGVRWWKRDNFENKYPSLSPYSYSANNPILFIDPDGNIVKKAIDEFTIQNEGKINNAIQKNPRLYNYLNTVALNMNKNFYPYEQGEEKSQGAFEPIFTITAADLNRRTLNHHQIGSGETYSSREDYNGANYILHFVTGFGETEMLDHIKNNSSTYFENANKPTEDELNRLESELIAKGRVMIDKTTINIDVNQSDFSIGKAMAHEFGGLEYELKHPYRSYIHSVILPYINPDFNFKGGHGMDTDPHKEGSKQGELEYERNNK